MKKIIASGYDHLSNFVEALTVGRFDEGGTVLHDGRNTVKLFETDGRRYVVKRFRVPHFFDRVMYTFFRGTKAKRAYENARRLEQEGVGTPAAVAYADTRRGGLVAHSYLVTEYTDYKPIRDLIKEEKYLHAMGVNALVDFIIALHDKGIKHKDLNSTNIVYRIDADLRFDFQLIDINRMSFGRMSRRECIANLTRICDETRLIYFISQKYAEHRGWDRNYSLGLLAFYRGKFENKKKRSAYLKRLFSPVA
ncbi:MAG: lipopolysaccharide kinase InaA family protein [Rikenellaceae bacterium]|nr:lipopolysaccharide kinase InaA family protein [Rikenellaceae bacterium]